MIGCVELAWIGLPLVVLALLSPVLLCIWTERDR